MKKPKIVYVKVGRFQQKRKRLVLQGIDVDELAERFKVKLIVVDDPFVKESGMDWAWWLNRSESSGSVSDRPEIIIGAYSDDELKLLSFFHELGHVLTPDPAKLPDMMAVERAAWRIGYAVAESMGVRFSPRAKAWARRQLAAYKDYR